jgi:AcrR family transcriptional regulator
VPKRADHDARRRQIIDAVIRVTLRGGLGAATFREVAAEAGVSVRLIQYYFGSKADLLVATQRAIADRATTRLMAAMKKAGPEPGNVLRAVMLSFLPRDDESRVSMLMFVALHTASLLDPTLKHEQSQEVPRSLQRLVETQLKRTGISDHHLAAATLVALVPTLAQSVLDGSSSLASATRTIDYALSMVLGRGATR